MREVSKEEFYAAVGALDVHPRSERDATWWETPGRRIVGKSEPGYVPVAGQPHRYFLAVE